MNDGEDINARDKWNDTPLVWASKYKEESTSDTTEIHKMMTEILIDRGADWRSIEIDKVPNSLKQFIETSEKVKSDRLMDVAKEGRVCRAEADSLAAVKASKPKL